MSHPSSKKLIPVAREGFPFILPLLGLGLLLYWLDFIYSGIFCLATGAFCVFFFRDPEREIPSDPKAIVSPADGRVIGIAESHAEGFDEPVIKVSIFLSVFNVHINRSPIAGKVNKVVYKAGLFKAAWVDKASSDNEQNTLTIAGDQIDVVVKQIAGLIARRIVCWVKPGEYVEKGERIGLIRFGSRTEIFLPRSVQVKVKVGDKVKGGKSIVALLGE